MTGTIEERLAWCEKRIAELDWRLAELQQRRPKTIFNPPKRQDAIGYFIERKSTAREGEIFCDYFESKGWKVGAVPMKSWQAAARNWIRRNEQQEGKLIRRLG